MRLLGSTKFYLNQIVSNYAKSQKELEVLRAENTALKSKRGSTGLIDTAPPTKRQRITDPLEGMAARNAAIEQAGKHLAVCFNAWPHTTAWTVEKDDHFNLLAARLTDEEKQQGDLHDLASVLPITELPNLTSPQIRHGVGST